MPGLVGPEHTTTDCFLRCQMHNAVINEHCLSESLNLIVPEEIATYVVEFTIGNSYRVLDVRTFPGIRSISKSRGRRNGWCLTESKHTMRSIHALTVEVKILYIHRCGCSNRRLCWGINNLGMTGLARRTQCHGELVKIKRTAHCIFGTAFQIEIQHLSHRILRNWISCKPLVQVAAGRNRFEGWGKRGESELCRLWCIGIA